MRSLPNIERSGFRPGEYVGYLHGYAVRIIRGEAGWRVVGYCCAAKEGQPAPYMYARTLTVLSKLLVECAK